ncbi:cold-shock protein [Nocardia thraciensis]
MAEGIVKWFDKKRGYGFIAVLHGPNLFVHFSGIENKDVTWIQTGMRVSYEVEIGRRGPKAVNVRPAHRDDSQPRRQG